jgi:hypothetical protein
VVERVPAPDEDGYAIVGELRFRDLPEQLLGGDEIAVGAVVIAVLMVISFLV